MRSLVLLVLIALTALPAWGQAPALDPRQHETLERILIQLELLDSLSATDEVRARRSQALAEASQVTSESVTTTEQVRGLVARGLAARTRGYFDFIDVLWVFVGLTITVSVLGLAAVYLKPLLERLPREVLEGLGWAVSHAAIFGAAWVLDPVVAFIAALLGLALFLPLSAHRTYTRSLRPTFFVWAVVIGGAAVLHRSHFFGTLAVAALLGCLGCCFLPLLDGLFERRKEVVPTAFLASGLLLAGAAALGLTLDPPWFQVFEAATFWLAGAAFAGSLLTLSSRYYQGDLRLPYFVWQLVAVAAGVLALYVGHVLTERLDSAVLQETGGTFLALFFIGKVSELPWKARHWPWIALGVGLGGYWAVRFASQYPQYFLGL